MTSPQMPQIPIVVILDCAHVETVSYPNGKKVSRVYFGQRLGNGAVANMLQMVFAGRPPGFKPGYRYRFAATEAEQWFEPEREESRQEKAD